MAHLEKHGQNLMMGTDETLRDLDQIGKDLEILKADRSELLEMKWMLRNDETFRTDLQDLEETIMYLVKLMNE